MSVWNKRAPPGFFLNFRIQFRNQCSHMPAAYSNKMVVVATFRLPRHFEITEKHIGCMWRRTVLFQFFWFIRFFYWQKINWIFCGIVFKNCFKLWIMHKLQVQPFFLCEFIQTNYSVVVFFVFVFTFSTSINLLRKNI